MSTTCGVYDETFVLQWLKPTGEMLPNEKFTLECRDRYAEDGLVVDESNGEFAHCPLPRSMGDSGYYLLHDDHQHQGLLQSRDVGRKCYWIPHVKRWLTTTHFVEGYFELWDIFEDFNNQISEESRRKMGESRTGRTHTEETKRKISESHKGKSHSEETKRKMSELHKSKPMSETAKKRLGRSRTLSEEHRRKISESRKRYWERIRREKELNQPENHEEND